MHASQSTERMLFFERVHVMTCRTIVEHRVFYERLYAIKSQYYHWYAAEFNVLADNFIVCHLILMSIGSLASYRLGRSSTINQNRINSIQNTLSVYGTSSGNQN